jgi:hypothetical protein
VRDINLTSKNRVVKLFLNGISYDQIARQVGIAKGSVVNIINDFREGVLQVLPDMTEYIDTLRQVAVDLRKNNTSIAQVKSCLKLDIKLREMEVSSEEAEHLLDICHDMASPTVSTDRFVAASLELARSTTESGLSYGDVLNDYNAKLKKSRALSKELERNEQRLTDSKAHHREEKEQATRELDAVTKAIATAQDTFRKQKQDLKAQMDEYLAQHKLSWKKVTTAVALLDTELGRAGMNKADIQRLSKRICDAGSLVNVINQLEKQKKVLQSDVRKLAQKKQGIATSIKELKTIDNNLRTSIPKNKQDLDGLNDQLNSKKLELEELQQTASELTYNHYMSHLIISFLFDPKNISEYDLDRLVSLMVGLRQKRLGIGPKQVTDRDGTVICECQVPRMYGTITMSDADIDKARENFAYLLAPLVKDKFISKLDYQTREIEHGIEVLNAISQEKEREQQALAFFLAIAAHRSKHT